MLYGLESNWSLYVMQPLSIPKQQLLRGLAKTIKIICTPLKLFKINTEEIEVMVCISLSLLPAIRNDLTELKNACIAKNIDINLKNAKYILSKFLLSLIKRVNQIDEAMIEKGCDY